MTIVLDIGGEGRHPGAINLNRVRHKTLGPERGHPIPQLVVGRADAIPLADHSIDRVIIERIEETEQKIGGIIIPDTAKEKPQQGKVIAAGKGRVEKDGKVTPLDVKAGDTILFGKYAGQEIKIDGNEYLIVREEEILGVIEK